ncbi:hypothetical protein [Cohnella soli]|uniref:DUF5082 domain-containing protein n=1 Tax=Cohnella soli TaxID=425005 RepID=A0ABW0HM47_9BACL
MSMGQVKTFRTMLEPLIKGLEKDVEELQLRIDNHPDAPTYMTEDLIRMKDRLIFLRGQWADAENKGNLDVPIYEQGSIEYYRQSLGKYKEYLDTITIQDTQRVLGDEKLKPNQKIKMLNNLMKVYQEFKGESAN